MNDAARTPHTFPGTGRDDLAPVSTDELAAASTIAPFDRRVIAVGAAVFAVLLALSTRYGFHRDELYFMECARHLQASYVDQPVLTPLIAWVSLKLFGVSLLGLRKASSPADRKGHRHARAIRRKAEVVTPT